eukprot:7167489-Prymnesium_polylepis.1
MVCPIVIPRNSTRNPTQLQSAPCYPNAIPADRNDTSSLDRRFFDVTDRVSLIDPTVEGGLRPASVRGDIEVRDVVFAYPSAPEHIICKGYSLSIAAGQSVALCGASGSG